MIAAASARSNRPALTTTSALKGPASRYLVAARERLRTSLFARTMLIPNSRAVVSFTFDDFPRSAVSNGARLLQEYGARGTFYLTGSYCGKVVDGIKQYDAEDVISVAAAGHEIGCHTFTHSRVSKLSSAALRTEIERNANFLDRHLPGRKLRTFAYPFGDLSFTATMRLQSRFVACRSSEPGLNIEFADLGRLRSVRLYNRLVGPEDISAIVKKAANSRAWLIFYTHDVNETPSNFGCTPALFEHTVKTVVAAGAEIHTVEAAIRRSLGRADSGRE